MVLLLFFCFCLELTGYQRELGSSFGEFSIIFWASNVGVPMIIGNLRQPLMAAQSFCLTKLHEEDNRDDDDGPFKSFLDVKLRQACNNAGQEAYCPDSWA